MHISLFSRCLIILFIFISIPAFALQQQTRLWAGIDLSGDFFNVENWLYDINSQARYTFTDSQYQTTQSEASLGYKTSDKLSLWLGYSWLIENANSTQQHRLWQQIIWNILDNDQFNLMSRSRLEERKDVYEPEWSIRLRQRLQLSFPKLLFHTLTPIIYNELFVNINNPPWVNNQLINQNRVFVGIDIPIWKKVDVQVGYLNQYQIREPENRDNHIIYANLNIKT